MKTSDILIKLSLAPGFKRKTEPTKTEKTKWKKFNKQQIIVLVVISVVVATLAAFVAIVSLRLVLTEPESSLSQVINLIFSEIPQKLRFTR